MTLTAPTFSNHHCITYSKSIYLVIILSTLFKGDSIRSNVLTCRFLHQYNKLRRKRGEYACRITLYIPACVIYIHYKCVYMFLSKLMT